MKPLFLTVYLLMIFASSAAADDRHKWTWEDTGLQTVFAGIWVADWSQTLHIARNPTKYYERGNTQGFVHLGNHPSIGRINSYFAGYLAWHTFVAYKLSKPYRTIWQGAYIIYDYDKVQKNRSIGIGLSVHF